MKAVRKSALLKTSAVTDVQSSGGVLSITGLDPIRKNDILSITQLKYRAEVSQVVTVGVTYTPAASTAYSIELLNVNGKREGFTGRAPKYGYTTPAVLTNIGANAAAQREYINLAIVAAINADSSNKVVAASLGGGTGFTITDDAGYYPARNTGNAYRQGATNVIAITNSDGSGWTSADVAISTAAVYGFGVGSRMDDDIPVIYGPTGNLVTGELEAPVTTSGEYAVSGQQYDAFSIVSLGIADAHAVSNQKAHVLQEQIIFVDNGAGSATTNATGFINFERAMLRELFDVFVDDQQAVVEFFDNQPIFAGASGGATSTPSGTAQASNVMLTGKNALIYSPIATSTIMSMAYSTNGLKMELDSTDNEGVEITPSILANSPKAFTIGKDEFSVYARFSISDVSGTDDMLVGFRKQAAFTANVDDYTDMAALNVISGDIYIETILNNNATVSTDTTLNWADGETHTLEVRVTKAGVASFYVDGVNKTSVLASTFTFDTGDVVIPFIYSLQATDLSDNIIKTFAVLPTANWRI